MALVTPSAVHARGKGSGVEVRAGGAMVWRVQDGKIVEARFFQTKEEALAAVACAGEMNVLDSRRRNR